MKQVILASAFLLASGASALAQDLNWTGAYAGAHVGYSWGNASTTDNIKDWCTPGDTACIAKYVGPFGYGVGGAFGGGTAGYNYQFQGAVFGIEGDLGYMDLSGGRTSESSSPEFHQNETTSGGLYGDITGRAGILLTPQALVYGKGGFAFYDGSSEQKTTKPGFVSHDTGTFTGWVAGGGLEYLLTEKISLKIEYLHFGFGDQGGDQTSTSDGYVFSNKTSLDADSVKVGINYHF